MPEIQATVTWEARYYTADLQKPLDISLPLREGNDNPTAWYCGPVEITPVMSGGFTGSVALGGSVNFRDIRFNPHGHGTHTESYGHIAADIYPVSDAVTTFFSVCRLVSVAPDHLDDDLVITEKAFRAAVEEVLPGAVVIRTLPNTEEKKQHNYSNTNPPYLEASLLAFLRDQGVEHLLTDLPSVDRESDNGVLAGHHAFWNYPEAPRKSATITELVFADTAIPDGLYLLELQLAHFVNDAAPSRPVLYALHPRRI